MRAKLLLSVIALVFFYSCQQSNDAELKETYLDLPETPYSYSPSDTANNNVPTLGRVLFYDTRLSANNAVSCATCHKQELAFADNVALSVGFMGQKTGRNSMPIQNLKSNNKIFFFRPDGSIVADSGKFDTGSHTLFWDGRETLVEAQVLMPITNHVEMGMTIDDLTNKLSSLPEYA